MRSKWLKVQYFGMNIKEEISLKILVINSSPRKGSNSTILSEIATLSAYEEGATVKTVDLSKMSIAPCTACDGCRAQKVNCVIKDDMRMLYEDVKEADGIIIATPVYWFSVPSFLKVFMDRLYGLYGDDDKFMKDKCVSLIMTHAEEEVELSGAHNVHKMMADSVNLCGGSIHTVLSYSCHNVGEIRENLKAIEEVRELGKSIANIKS